MKHHRVVISVVFCGGCSHIMEPVETGEFRCVNAQCEHALSLWRPRIFMDEILRDRADIPGVRAS